MKSYITYAENYAAELGKSTNRQCEDVVNIALAAQNLYYDRMILIKSLILVRTNCISGEISPSIRAKETIKMSFCCRTSHEVRGLKRCPYRSGRNSKNVAPRKGNFYSYR